MCNFGLKSFHVCVYFSFIANEQSERRREDGRWPLQNRCVYIGYGLEISEQLHIFLLTKESVTIERLGDRLGVGEPIQATRSDTERLLSSTN